MLCTSQRVALICKMFGWNYSAQNVSMLKVKPNEKDELHSDINSRQWTQAKYGCFMEALIEPWKLWIFETHTITQKRASCTMPLQKFEKYPYNETPALRTPCYPVRRAGPPPATFNSAPASARRSAATGFWLQR